MTRRTWMVAALAPMLAAGLLAAQDAEEHARELLRLMRQAGQTSRPAEFDPSRAAPAPGEELPTTQPATRPASRPADGRGTGILPVRLPAGQAGPTGVPPVEGQGQALGAPYGDAPATHGRDAHATASQPAASQPVIAATRPAIPPASQPASAPASQPADPYAASALDLPQPGLELYVSPGGSNHNSGSADQPLATVVGARDAIRAYRESRGPLPKGGVRVYLRGGWHYLTETVIFEAADSGTADAPIVYASYPGEAAILSGANEITGWRKAGNDAPGLNQAARGKVFVAEVPQGWLFHSLYVNGRPQPRARRPDRDDPATWPRLVAAGKPGENGQLLTFGPGQLDWIPSGGDVEANILPSVDATSPSRSEAAGAPLLRERGTAVPAVRPTGVPPLNGQGQDAPATHGRDAHATDKAAGAPLLRQRGTAVPAVRPTGVPPVDGQGQALGAPYGDAPATHSAGRCAGRDAHATDKAAGAPLPQANTLSVLMEVNPARSTARRHSRNITLPVRGGDPFRLENALALLTKPGQWCVHSSAGRVYYWPPEGRMDGVRIHASVLFNLVRFSDEEEGTGLVKHVHLRGLVLMHTDRMSEHQWPDHWIRRNGDNPEGAVHFHGAEDCSIEMCRLFYAGGYGVSLERQARRIRVVGNEMAYLGGGGVMLTGQGPGTVHERGQNVISRNYIHHAGLAYTSAAGIAAYGSGQNLISYNYLHDLPACGVAILGVPTADLNRRSQLAQRVDAYGSYEDRYKVQWEQMPPGSRERFHEDAGTLTRADVRRFLQSGSNLVGRNIISSAGCGLYAIACGGGNAWVQNVIYTPRPSAADPIVMDDEADQAIVRGNVAWSAGTLVSRSEDNVVAGNAVEPNRSEAFDLLLGRIMDEVGRQGGYAGRITNFTK